MDDDTRLSNLGNTIVKIAESAVVQTSDWVESYFLLCELLMTFIVCTKPRKTENESRRSLRNTRHAAFRVTKNTAFLTNTKTQTEQVQNPLEHHLSRLCLGHRIDTEIHMEASPRSRLDGVITLARSDG
jgi:hypothetical protein